MCPVSEQSNKPPMRYWWLLLLFLILSSMTMSKLQLPLHRVESAAPANNCQPSFTCNAKRNQDLFLFTHRVNIVALSYRNNRRCCSTAPSCILIQLIQRRVQCKQSNTMWQHLSQGSCQYGVHLQHDPGKKEKKPTMSQNNIGKTNPVALPV